MFTAFVFITASFPASATETATDPRALEFFEKRVRPVLIERCQQCHGPKKQEAGLRLDSLEGIVKGGDGGPAIVPHKPAESLLIQAVRRENGIEMPPKEPLKPEQVADLERWVADGAAWPKPARPAGDSAASSQHWAFQPIQRPAIPRIADEVWPATSIDVFVLARLEGKKLRPSPPADRRTLLRRLTYDVTGLPPTPEELDAFENDPSPDAYVRQFDRLLASPRHGEHWARHWLDVARYSDTKGYVFFENGQYPFAYTYRDYVISALNRDLPYDRFILEQLAADQLPQGDDPPSLAAMGFVTVGGKFMNNPHDIIDDRIDVVGRGLLGLTITCARCHDHKYDPIPTADYYSLYGVFASSIEPTVLPLSQPPPKTEEFAKYQTEFDARVKALTTFVDGKYNELVTAAKTRAAEYLMAAHAASNLPVTDDFMLLADGGDLNPAMIRRWESYLERMKRRRDPVFAPWHALAALPSEKFADDARRLLEQWKERSDPAAANPHVVAALLTNPPKRLSEAAKAYSDLLNATERAWNDLVADATKQGRPTPAQFDDPARESLRQVFLGPEAPPKFPEPSSGDLLTLLPDRPAQEQLQKVLKAVEEWQTGGSGAPPRAMVLIDAPQPYDPFVFIRGNPNRRGETVPRQWVSLLSQGDRMPFEKGSGRLDMAKAVVDPSNPLTARVHVNRIWMHYFGSPLVRTPGDFGLRSDPPTHPALLDYLADEFIRSGWSTKHIHRLILLSATYQQKSDDRSECSSVDPENLLLWRMNRRRLDFEPMRDTLLVVSGRLDARLGGPSANVLTQPFTGRRTIYAHIDRLQLPTLLRTFDYPSPDATSPQRSETTVAPQALFWLNHPFVADCALWTADRPDVASETDHNRRIDRIFHILFGHGAAEAEIEAARRYLGKFPNSPASLAQYIQILLMSNEMAFLD